jgi:hypothetical protein
MPHHQHRAIVERLADNRLLIITDPPRNIDPARVNELLHGETLKTLEEDLKLAAHLYHTLKEQLDQQQHHIEARRGY